MRAAWCWDPGRRGRVPARPATALVVVVVAAVAAAAGCSGSDVADHDPPRAVDTGSAGRSDLADATMWLSFDDDTVDYDGATAYPDALGGPFAGRVVTANGGKVERVTGADGSHGAVAFPAKCTASTGCPRAMVEVLPDPALDPGERPFEFGATVWLAPDQTTTGSNLVQKGRYGTEGGQWKLQVDSESGEPSCVVRSGSQVVVVRSSVSVADSRWHRVVCRRDERGVAISVDDVVDREAGPTRSVTNPWPVRVGSPGVGDQDDQFHGRIDDVFLRIGP